MGIRYASHSQEVLYRDGRLVGFNAGYGFHAEHNGEYGGDEQRKRENSPTPDKDNPFDGEIIASPKEVNMMEFRDGNVWITSDSWKYVRLMTKTEQERQETMLEYINNSDRKVTEDFLNGWGKDTDSPDVVALWDAGFRGAGGSFDLISTNRQSSELLRKLYAEIQKGNVAVSSDYSFMFEDRGLSFVLLDQLSKEDLEKKQLIDYRAELAKQFLDEYREYLSQQGLGEFRSQYPVEFCNLQIRNLVEKPKGEIVPEFYLTLIDTSKGRDSLDGKSIPKVPRIISGNAIKFLVPIVQTQEYAEFAKNHSREEIGEYLNSKLEIYYEKQRLAEEQGYQIGEDSLGAIAAEQRKGIVEQRGTSLKGKVTQWLHPEKEEKKDKTEE